MQVHWAQTLSVFDEGEVCLMYSPSWLCSVCAFLEKSLTRLPLRKKT